MFNGLMPSEELIKDYSLAEKKQVPYIVRGNVVVTVCFFFLAVILAMGHLKIVGLVTIIPLEVLISAMLMLKKAIKMPLLAMFVAICTLGIIISGYLFNAIELYLL